MTPVAEAETVNKSLSAYGPARSTVSGTPLSTDELRKTHAYWRACNYLTLGMIYLQDNPLLREPLKTEHIKNRLLGHWGSSPGLAFTYIHLNRLIKKYDLDVSFLPDPGMALPALSVPFIWKGRIRKSIPIRVKTSMVCASFLNNFPSPAALEVTAHRKHPARSTKEASLGYVLSHACGAAFDNPDLIVAAVVGDGEAETGALATSWHINKFLNPIRDGAVLPILHLERLQDQ